MTEKKAPKKKAPTKKKDETISVNVEQVEANAEAAHQTEVAEKLEKMKEDGKKELSEQQLNDMATEHRLLVEHFVNHCKAQESNPMVAIAAGIAAAGTIAHMSIQDTEKLRNYITHCFADVLAKIEIERGAIDQEIITEATSAPVVN